VEGEPRSGGEEEGPTSGFFSGTREEEGENEPKMGEWEQRLEGEEDMNIQN